MAAVKNQHKNCLQSTLRNKIINTLFAGLGRSVLEKNCALGLALHTAVEPAVHAAVKYSVSYRNDTKIAFFFAASKLALASFNN